VLSPLWAEALDWFIGLFGSGNVSLGGADYSFPGVRLALWSGGIVTFAAGFWARRSVLRAERFDGTHDATVHELPESGAA
jgi:hypothetical protein